MSDRILRKAMLRAEEDYADDGQVEAGSIEAVEEAMIESTPLPVKSKNDRWMRERAQAATQAGLQRAQRSRLDRTTI